MATFAQIAARVSARIQDPNNTAVSAASVADCINQALGDWKFRRFWFNEKVSDEVLVTSDAGIPVPDDFLVFVLPDGGPVIEYSGIRYPLKKLLEPVYNWNYLSNGIGQPYWYAKMATDMWQAYPIPDRDYTVKCYYLKEYDPWDGTDTTATNDFTENADTLLMYSAAQYASADLRQDMVMGQYFEKRADDEFRNLQVMTTKTNATGSLVVSSMLTE